MFLGYSNLHKGFKFLDVAEGWVYISRYIVFDETVFPFASLHPNAGAQLRAEILLLPTHLHNSSDATGVDNSCDSTLSSPTTDVVCESADDCQELPHGFAGEIGTNFGRYFMQNIASAGAEHEVDPPMVTAPESPSRSPPVR